jgi:hypothetical protein
MSFGRVKIACSSAGIGALCWCVVPEAVAQQSAPRETVPIQFSSPLDNTAISNLNTTLSQKKRSADLLNYYPQGGSASPSFGPGQSQSPMIVRTPAPVVRSRQIMQMIEKRKDWVFSEPDEKEFGLAAEQIFNLPQQDPEQGYKERVTATERYFRDGNDTKAKPSGYDTTAGDSGAAQNSSFWSVDSGSAQSGFASLFGQPTSSDSVNPLFQSQFSQSQNWDPFGLEKSVISTGDRSRTQEGSLGQFNQLLGSQAVTPSTFDAGNAPWLTQSGSASSATKPDSFSGFSAFQQNKSSGSFSLAPGLVGMPASPGSLQEASTAPGAMPSLTPESPETEQPRKTMPPPVFDMPRSHF